MKRTAKRPAEDRVTGDARPLRGKEKPFKRQSSPAGRSKVELRERVQRGAAADGKTVIPVVAEEVRVDRRSVETGRVRLTKLVREQQEVVDQPSFSEEVVVERVPINRVVETAPQPRQEGDTVIFPVLEEVVVVERRLMLKEEVRITKRVTETRNPQEVTLRSEDVKIERIPAEDDRAGM